MVANNNQKIGGGKWGAPSMAARVREEPGASAFSSPAYQPTNSLVSENQIDEASTSLW